MMHGFQCYDAKKTKEQNKGKNQLSDFIPRIAEWSDNCLMYKRYRAAFLLH